MKQKYDKKKKKQSVSSLILNEISIDSVIYGI